MSPPPDGRTAPRIVVTLGDPERAADAAIARRKNELYLTAVRRHGGLAVPLDERAGAGERQAAFDAMDGLLLTGGADLDPALYAQRAAGSRDIERGRDALEVAAWRAAAAGDRPVLGICRGFQAINVFLGGTLLQHVDGHRGPAYPEGPPATHPLTVRAGTLLARLLFDEGSGETTLSVNTYHHQAVRPEDLAPGLVIAATSPGPGGDLVEAFESGDGRFVVGVQCHPERTESTPPAFERIFASLVEEARR